MVKRLLYITLLGFVLTPSTHSDAATSRAKQSVAQSSAQIPIARQVPLIIALPPGKILTEAQDRWDAVRANWESKAAPLLTSEEKRARTTDTQVSYDLELLKDRHKDFQAQRLTRRGVIEKLSEQVSTIVDGDGERVNNLIQYAGFLHEEIFIALIRAYVFDNDQETILTVITTFPEHVQRALKKEFYYHTDKWLDAPLTLSISEMIRDGILPLPIGINISRAPAVLIEIEKYCFVVDALELTEGKSEEKEEKESKEEKKEEKPTSQSSQLSILAPELVKIYAEHRQLGTFIDKLPVSHSLFRAIIKHISNLPASHERYAFIKEAVNKPRLAQEMCKQPGFIDWFVLLPKETGPNASRTKVLGIIDQEAKEFVATLPDGEKEFAEFNALPEGLFKMEVRKAYHEQKGRLIDECDIVGIMEHINAPGSNIFLSNNLIRIRSSLEGIVELLIAYKPNITELCLNNNQLSGVIPTSIGNLTNLTKLHLVGNKLSGVIPTSIGNLKKLTELHLEANRLSGVIPESIGNNLTNLRRLFLNNNQLSGVIPASIGNLKKLTELNLSLNQLSGAIPTSIGNLTNLRELSLNHNQLSGAIPTSIGNLTNLDLLELSYNQLSGVIPASIGNLTNLRRLFLNNNQLSGAIQTSMGSLTNLTYFDLRNTPLLIKPPAIIDALRNRLVTLSM